MEPGAAAEPRHAAKDIVADPARLTEYLRRQGGELSEFLSWLELTREQVLELPTTNFTHFEDVLDVQANTIRLRPRPEELVFVSAKSTSAAAAPWLAV
jgi:hypothetical protein